MKKRMICLTTILALMLCAVSAQAAGRGPRGGHMGGNGQHMQQRGNFADANGDGICDNCGQGCGRNFVDADNDGICDNRGQGCGMGRMAAGRGQRRGK